MKHGAGRPQPRLFDMMVLATHVEKRPLYFDLAKKIRIAFALGAVLLDLGIAEGFLAEIRRILDAADTAKESDWLHVQALTTAAVMAYARAVQSKTEGRFRIGFDPQHPDLKARHARVIAVRDKVIAHYGRGDRAGQSPWVDDRFVLRVHGAEVRQIYPAWRATWKGEMLTDLGVLLPAVREHYLQRQSKAGDKLNDALLAAMDRDPEFMERALKQSVFDPYAYFPEDRAQAERLLWSDGPPGTQDFGFFGVPRSHA